MESPLQISVDDGVLVVRFPRDYDAVSWAPIHGGARKIREVRNIQVAGGACGPDPDRRLPDDAAGLLTAAVVADFTESFLAHDPLWVHAVATVGLTNAKSVLDPPDVDLRPGTINLVVASNGLPTEAARFQAIHVVAAAKTAALRDAGIISRKSDRPADLTGTDTLVVASSGEIREMHCGLHTPTGSLLGRAVHDVVTRGIARAEKSGFTLTGPAPMIPPQTHGTREVPKGRCPRNCKG